MDEDIIDEFETPSQPNDDSVHDGGLGGLRPQPAVVISEGRYMAKVAVVGLARGRGDRKAGRCFSARSRKGLFDWLNSVDWSRVKLPSFVTLTYGQAFPDARKGKEHLRLLWYRLRSLCGNVGFLWRLEYQDRGAPHFHLLVFGVYIDKRKLQEVWADVIGKEFWDYSVKPCRYPFTRIEGLRSVNGVKFYVGKYLAKGDKAGIVPPSKPSELACSQNEGSVSVETVDGTAAGTRLGCDEGRGASPDAVAAGSPGFNSYTNSAAGQREDGRHWGVMGRGFVPRAPVTVTVFEGTAVNLSRARLLAALYHRQGYGPCPDESFTLYKGRGHSEGCVLADYEKLLTHAESCCRVQAVQ